MKIYLCCVLCVCACFVRPTVNAADVNNAASSADDVLDAARKSMDEAAWLELGSTAWAEAIEKSSAQFSDLALTQKNIVQMSLAEAYLAARRIDKSVVILKGLADKKLTSNIRHRFAQALILQWTHRWQMAKDMSTIPSARKMLQEYGEFSSLIQARAHVAEAARLTAMDKSKKALIQYDAAIALLRDAEVAERQTVYQLRLTTMEAAGLRQSVISDWFEARRKDPAVKTMMSQMFSSGQSLQGKKLPFKNEIMKLKCDDGTIKPINFFEIPGHGRIIFVFASWSKGSGESAPVVASVLNDWKDKIDVLSISLDTEDSLERLQAFRQVHGLSGVIIAEGTGWESTLAKDLQIESIPTIILIDKQGVIRAMDIHGASPQQTEKRLRQSIQEIVQEQNAIDTNDENEEDEEEDIP